MRDRDLRASLQQIGPQKPGLEHDGELLDGRRRALICAELGIRLEVREARTPEQACSLLWVEHPARALELAERHGVRGVMELARWCGVTPTAVARELQSRPRPATKPHRVRRIEGQPYPKLKKSSKMVRRLFVLEPELYAYMREAAAKAGHGNVNRLVRDAVWKEVALRVSNAPQFQPRRVQAPNGLRSGRRRTGT